MTSVTSVTSVTFASLPSPSTSAVVCDTTTFASLSWTVSIVLYEDYSNITLTVGLSVVLFLNWKNLAQLVYFLIPASQGVGLGQ